MTQVCFLIYGGDLDKLFLNEREPREAAFLWKRCFLRVMWGFLGPDGAARFQLT